MMTASFARALPRSWLLSALVLGFAALIRFRHYDIAWFGLDQIYFMAEARRILAGHFDVVGPLASGLNIIGPLYSYLLAGLLWIRDDPRFLGLFSVTCEVIASWFVYDTARRVAGPAAGIAAAVTYVTAPVLVLSTRMIWNPTLVPALVALGWWLVVRYVQAPSSAKLVGVALISGLTLTLHATGVFHAAGLMLAVLVARRPTLRQLLAALVAGVLPLVPVILLLKSNTTDVGVLGSRFAWPGEFLPIIKGLCEIVLNFPRAFARDWSADLAASVLRVQAIVATLGLAYALVGRSAYWPVWVGVTVAVVSNVASAIFYAGSISWHYFIALVPIACLCGAQAIGSLPRWRVTAAGLMSSLAASLLLFIGQVDGEAIASGLIRVDAGLVGFRVASVIGYSPTVRELHNLGHTLREVIPDGSTAMLMAHGIRGDLWRETGAEFMPKGDSPRSDWPTQFMLMGPGATPLIPSARMLGERVCVFERSPLVTWKSRHGALSAGWELPDFIDGDWIALELPRRTTGPSLAGPFRALATWRVPQMLLRGRFTVDALQRQRAFSVSIHGVGSSQHWIAQVAVNGKPLAVTRERVMYSSMTRNQEWLIDLTSALRTGENVIALAIDGQVPAFDLDVFEVPCLDREWYY
jgi:hypothetical protein